MSECGIEKYDKLPARVRFIDVDYLRFCLFREQNKIKKCHEQIEIIKKQLDEVIEQSSQ